MKPFLLILLLACSGCCSYYATEAHRPLRLTLAPDGSPAVALDIGASWSDYVNLWKTDWKTATTATAGDIALMIGAYTTVKDAYDKLKPSDSGTAGTTVNNYYNYGTVTK